MKTLTNILWLPTDCCSCCCCQCCCCYCCCFTADVYNNKIVKYSLRVVNRKAKKKQKRKQKQKAKTEIFNCPRRSLTESPLPLDGFAHVARIGNTWRRQASERERERAGSGEEVQVPVVGCHLFRKCSRRSSMSKSNRSRGVALWKYLSVAIDICRRRTGNAICLSNLNLKSSQKGQAGVRGCRGGEARDWQRHGSWCSIT